MDAVDALVTGDSCKVNGEGDGHRLVRRVTPTESLCSALDELSYPKESWWVRARRDLLAPNQYRLENPDNSGSAMSVKEATDWRQRAINGFSCDSAPK